MNNNIADKIFLSNAIFTGDGSLPFPGGVAVSGNKIIAVGEKIRAFTISAIA